MAENPLVPTQGDTERARAVGALLTAARRLIEVRDLRWEKVQEDSRLLVVNYVLRRQLESLEAALKLASENLGHLSVAFVRTALDEMLWVRFLASLEVETSQRLLLAMANYDGLRSLLAQRGYVGDDVMASLWYPVEFLDAAERKLVSIKEDLKQLRAELGWRRTLPSSDWVAEYVNKTPLYEYLHSATSRAVHFSAGEVFRRGWGDPKGMLVTDKPEFREHLSEFALDRLWRLLFETIDAALPLLEASGITSSDQLTDEVLMPLLDEVLRLGQVTLVHAAEWNLTPEGPLKSP